VPGSSETTPSRWTPRHSGQSAEINSVKAAKNKTLAVTP
jgi:hypothetical protein